MLKECLNQLPSAVVDMIDDYYCYCEECMSTVPLVANMLESTWIVYDNIPNTMLLVASLHNDVVELQHNTVNGDQVTTVQTIHIPIELFTTWIQHEYNMDDLFSNPRRNYNSPILHINPIDVSRYNSIGTMGLKFNYSLFDNFYSYFDEPEECRETFSEDDLYLERKTIDEEYGEPEAPDYVPVEPQWYEPEYVTSHKEYVEGDIDTYYSTGYDD